ncbi:hypothetical protein FNV43_RR00953 [Rhamnella rubrinervis]|uniref:Uncharacterized protein n=1 Tax=Rhamnella rubrinervis TaxID=2594499 RepID=A0A8K0HQJ4_9ROSA|nr:hypothetical protein FNV43_RR00953 [Rhamnella rubrinervis]
MASNNKASDHRDLEGSTSSNQNQVKKPNTSEGSSTSSNIEKALAKRALLGSHHRRGRRSSANYSATTRSLPSRLSKVSLADHQDYSAENSTSQVSF